MGNSIRNPTSTHLAYFWWSLLHEKSSINSKIQNFGRGTLRIFPFDGQIQGDFVVGTINSDNLGESNYLCPLITIGLTSS